MIDATMDDKGDLVTDTEQLLSVWRSFYTQLFTSEPIDEDLQDDFLDFLGRILPREERDSCEGLLSVDGSGKRSTSRRPAP